MNLTAMIIGAVISLVTQFITKNEGKLTAWMTPERTKTIQAFVALLSIVTGILVAAQTPGGLASMDWQHIVVVGGEAIATIWVAAVAVYVGIIKPLVNQLAAKKEADATQLK